MKFFIEWPNPPSGFEKRAAEIEGRLSVELFLEAGTFDQPRSVSVVRKGAGCGCSFVDGPRVDASVWQLNREASEALADSVRALGATSPLALHAAWLGADQPDQSCEELSLSALAARVREGQLIPGRKYVVPTGG